MLKTSLIKNYVSLCPLVSHHSMFFPIVLLRLRLDCKQLSPRYGPHLVPDQLGRWPSHAHVLTLFGIDAHTHSPIYIQANFWAIPNKVKNSACKWRFYKNIITKFTIFRTPRWSRLKAKNSVGGRYCSIYHIQGLVFLVLYPNRRFSFWPQMSTKRGWVEVGGIRKKEKL